MSIQPVQIDPAREEEREDFLDDLEEGFEIVMTANWLSAEGRSQAGRELLELAGEAAYEVMKQDPVDGTFFGGPRRKIRALIEDLKKKNPKRLRRRAARLTKRGLVGMAQALLTEAERIEAGRGNGG